VARLVIVAMRTIRIARLTVVETMSRPSAVLAREGLDQASALESRETRRSATEKYAPRVVRPRLHS